MNRHKKRAAASYDIPLSDSKLFVLYACQSENGHIRMRQPFSYLSLQTFLCRHFRVSEKFHFARVSHDNNHEYCAMRIQERLGVLAAPRRVRSTFLFARLRSAGGFYSSSRDCTHDEGKYHFARVSHD